MGGPPSPVSRLVLDTRLRGSGVATFAWGDDGLFDGVCSASPTLSKLETVVLNDCASPSMSIGTTVLLHRSSLPVSKLSRVSASLIRGVLDLSESGDWRSVC
jgi:hypothetical protein